jgi:hypothetical protein
MLRPSWVNHCALISLAVLAASQADAQPIGLSARLTAAEARLEANIAGCTPITDGQLDEARALREEAISNDKASIKAKRLGLPVDRKTVTSDYARAHQLVERAAHASVHECGNPASILDSVEQADRFDAEQRKAERERQRASESPAPAQQPVQVNLPSWARDILAAHNAARSAVGAPPLQWNSALQDHATARAGDLARLRQLVHAPREGRGTERENILSAPVGYSPGAMMNLWTKERSHFKPGLFPDVSDTGNWSDVAHYTQMVWPTTTEIGCGFAPGGGFNWLVCRYNPGGNKDGKPVIAQATAKTDVPATPASGVVATYDDYGYDGALFVGYDLGAFRLDAETAYRTADDVPSERPHAVEQPDIYDDPFDGLLGSPRLP